MNRTDFINEVFTFFKCKDDDLKKAYDLALTVRERIDWSKLYNIVINQAESRYLPMPKWFKDFFPRCYMTDGAKYDGFNVRIYIKDEKLENGYPYEFVTVMNNSPLEDLKQMAMRKFGDKFISFQVYNEDVEEWQKI